MASMHARSEKSITWGPHTGSTHAGRQSCVHCTPDRTSRLHIRTDVTISLSSLQNDTDMEQATACMPDCR